MKQTREMEEVFEHYRNQCNSSWCFGCSHHDMWREDGTRKPDECKASKPEECRWVEEECGKEG